MAVLGFLEWYRQLRAFRFPAAGDPPGSAAGTGGAGGSAPLAGEGDAPAGDGICPPATRLLLGTACGSALLLGIAVSARVATGLGTGVLTPLTATVLGTLGAAVVTALAARIGRALRGRSEPARLPEVSASPNPADEQPPQPGREHGDVP
ncbi:hypothetical protein [Streptomyces sp. NPDC003710]